MRSQLISRIGPVVALVALPTFGWAQESTDSTRQQIPDSARFDLEGVAVEVTRPVSTGGGASAIEVEMANVPALPSPTLEEVLKKVPLLRVRRNSRGQAQPSMRGVEERQIAILVDGVPITLVWDNRTDLSVIPLTAAQDISVVRGLSSVLSGPNVLGGVINVGVTRGRFPMEVTRPVRLRLAGEHNGTYGLSGEASRLFHPSAGRLLVRAGGGFRNSPGAVMPDGLPGDLARPGAPLAGRDNLINSDMEQVNGFLALRFQGEGGAWGSLSSMAHDSNKGVLPELHVDEPRLWRIPTQWRSLTALSAGTGWRSTPWGEGDLEANVGIDFGHQEIDEFESFAYADSVGGETNDSRTLSARVVGDHTLGSGMLRSSFTLAETRHEQRQPDSDLTYKQRLWSLGMELDHPLGSRTPGESFVYAPSLNAGVTVDGASYPLTGDKPSQPTDWAWGARLAGSVLLGSSATRLHGGVSRKVRFAALRELFSGALGRFEPNPNLGPEVLKVGELAVTSQIGPVRTQVTAFQQRLEDAVVRVPLENGRLQRQNRNEIRSTGLEILANWEVDDVHFESELTLQDVEVRDPTDQENRPEYQPEIISGLRIDAPLGAGTRARAEVKHVGRQFCVNPDTGGMDAVDSSVYLEAGASREIPAGSLGLPNMRLSLAATNLADEVIYEQCGLPQAGRTFRIQLELF